MINLPDYMGTEQKRDEAGWNGLHALPFIRCTHPKYWLCKTRHNCSTEYRIISPILAVKHVLLASREDKHPVTGSTCS